MLTLPAEITNNKNLVGVRPILIVEFVDLEYHVASKAYELSRGSGADGVVSGGTTFTSVTATFETWNIFPDDIIDISGSERTVTAVNSETELEFTPSHGNGSSIPYEVWNVCNDLIQSNSSVKLIQKINEMMSGISGLIGSMKLNLLDFVSTLRNQLIGSSPDLSESNVNIYIKLDTSTDDFSNAIKIMEGVITSYIIQNDILSLTIKTRIDNWGQMPSNLLIDSFDDYSGVEDWCKPLQYGDFSWDLHPYLWVEFDKGLAFCPYASQEYYDPGPGLQPSIRWWVADHNMEHMPSTAQFQSTHDFHAFVYRDGKYCGVEIKDDDGTLSIVNSGGEAYFRTDYDFCKDVWDLCELEDEYTFGPYANDIIGWDECVDGSTLTSAGLSNGDNLTVEDVNIDHVKDNYQDSGVKARLIVTFGSNTHNGSVVLRIFDKVTDALQASNTIVSSTAANTTQVVTFNSVGSTDAINDYYFNVTATGGTSGSINVYNMTVAVSCPAHDPENEPYLLIRCQGRQYSGTWDGRKTTGNLIENPADVIESLFRDELSITDLDTDSFDNVYNLFDVVTTVNAAGTIIRQEDAEDIIKKICESFNISLIKLLSGNYRLFVPRAIIYNFSSSGTGTPGDEDIFTDNDTISNNEYTNHPIRQGTFKISRSQSVYNYRRLKIRFRYIPHKNVYDESVDSGGSGKSYIIDGWMIQEWDSANALKNVLDDWILHQKFIIEFETFINAAAHEIGDIINIRHLMLNDDMLDATENTQKWAIIELQNSWKPNYYKITAIELL